MNLLKNIDLIIFARRNKRALCIMKIINESKIFVVQSTSHFGRDFFKNNFSFIAFRNLRNFHIEFSA